MLLNLCGHDVYIYPESSCRFNTKQRQYEIISASRLQKCIRIKKSSLPPVRCVTDAQELPAIDGLYPAYSVRVKRVEYLPEYKPGVYLLVSSHVMHFLPERVDLVCPFMKVHHPKTHAVIGCMGLSMRS